jgi:hypothetical protein
MEKIEQWDIGVNVLKNIYVYKIYHQQEDNTKFTKMKMHYQHAIW